MTVYDNAGGYGHPSNGADFAMDVIHSPTGDLVFAIVESWDNLTGAYDFVTSAYDADTGTVIWTARYNGELSLADDPLALAVSADGSSVFVTGVINRDANGRGDFGTLAYDAATGQERWAATFDGGGYDQAADVAVSPDGKAVYVAGRSWQGPNPGDNDFVTIAYDAGSGNPLWKSNYDNQDGYELGAQLDLSADGQRLFVSGISAAFDEQFYFVSSAYALVEYEVQEGSQVSVRRYQGTLGFSVLTGATVRTADDRVFLTGYDYEGYGDDGRQKYGYLTVAYDQDSSSPVWTKRFGGLLARGFSYPTDIEVDPSGQGVFVTGASAAVDQKDPGLGMDASDYGTVSYDADSGQERWNQRYGGVFHDYASALSVSPDGKRVYVTGNSPRLRGRQHYETATLAYETATGRQVWVGRMDNPLVADPTDVAPTPLPEVHHDNWGVALAVSPDSRGIFALSTLGYGQNWNWVVKNRFDTALISYDSVKTCPDPGSDTAIKDQVECRTP